MRNKFIVAFLISDEQEKFIKSNRRIDINFIHDLTNIKKFNIIKKLYIKI